MRPLLLLAVLFTVGACSRDSGESSVAASDPAAAAAAALDESVPSERPSTTSTVPATTTTAHPTTTGRPTGPLDPTEIPGDIINQYTLELGNCFDQIRDLQNGLPVVVTTRLPCDGPHGFEVFHRFIYDVGFPALHPGEREMEDFALKSCYRKFEGWVGTKYELSELGIEVLVPTQTNFEDPVARYRGIHCFVHRIDGEPLVATTRRSGM